jgi:hypothetical protein
VLGQPVGLLDEIEWARLWAGYQGAEPFFEKDGEFCVP